LDNGDVGVQRKLYYRELIARFSHHLALNWNIGEENGKWMGNHPTPWQTTSQRLACAEYFYQHDPYHHHIVIHNGQPFYDILGPESKYTGLSIQTNRADFGNVHGAVLKWRHLANAAKVVWASAVDEPGDHRFSVVPDRINPDHDNARQNALWGALMAGAWGIEWYFGYENEHSDLTCQDWRSRDKMWDQSRYALDFFRNYKLPYWEMAPMDKLTVDSNDYVLAKPGAVYVIYRKIEFNGNVIIPEMKGNYQVTWYNPRTGQQAKSQIVTAKEGELLIKPLPEEPAKDWVLLVRK